MVWDVRRRESEELVAYFIYSHAISLSELLSNQYGVASYDQLIAGGASPRKIASAREQGWLERRGRWLVVDRRWSSPGPGLVWRRELSAALCALPPGQRRSAVVFRRSAAGLWGMDGATCHVVELAVSAGRPSLGHIHFLRSLRERDRDLVDGLPVTSIARTLLDLGQIVDIGALERAFQWALRERHATTAELGDALALMKGPPGTGALRQLLAVRPEATPPTESDAETLFVQVARRAGLPSPERQFELVTAAGKFRLDFAWPARALAVEVDGAASHANRQAWARDLRRQNRVLLELEGWTLLRFSWDDVALERFRPATIARLRDAWRLVLTR